MAYVAFRTFMQKDPTCIPAHVAECGRVVYERAAEPAS